MPSAAAVRLQVESTLARKIPSALTPQARIIRPNVPTGIAALDGLLGGGIPLGAVTELVGDECSGRTSIATAVIAGMTGSGRVCAWVDAANAFDPASTAAMGVALERLLWVRCAVEQQSQQQAPAKRAFAVPQQCFTPRLPTRGLHGGGFGPHPRGEARGMSEAMESLFAPQQPIAARLQPVPAASVPQQATATQTPRVGSRSRHYDAIERALRCTDLLLQTGGFSVLVLDLASIAAEHVARIELSTWHRYRVATEKQQACLLLLTQYPCAKSGSELQLRLASADPLPHASTVFEGMQPQVEIHRQRFAAPASNVISMRKGPQRETSTQWQNRTAWAGTR